MVFVVLRSNFKIVGILFVQWLHWEFLFVVLEKGSEFEVVLGVEIGFDSHIVLNQLQELLLQLVDLLCDEKWVNEGEISVGEVSIVPDFLGDQKRAKKHWPPICWLQRHLSESNKSIYIDQADDAAFWTELGAVVKSLNKFLYVLNSWSLSKQCNSLTVKCVGFFQDVFFLTEEKQFTLLLNLFTLILILEHLRMEDCCDGVDNAFYIWLRNSRSDVH